VPHPCIVNPELEGCAELALGDSSNAVVAKVLQYLEATEPFALEQAPLLVQETLRFAIFSAGFWIALSVALAAWAVFAIRWSLKGAEERLERIAAHTDALNELPEVASGRIVQPDDTTGDIAFSFLHYGIPVSGVVGGFIGVTVFFATIMTLVKPLIAPRLFLLEFFRAMAG
jgi:hypothetical protein